MDYITYRISDTSTSCQNEDGEDVALFQESDSDIAFTSGNFSFRTSVVCSSDITTFKEYLPTAMLLTRVY
ncbi:hypothetical protein [Gracilibacillus phocaeensis]|uniref:hypothetical protein n=1 Tax=Gracilibacillus phocaeensis TaxID=2042304 RepID=UPI0010325D58|nr:hypothetical protein [Gracilibacillus phocaeensis]